MSVPSDLRVKAKANMGLTVRLDVPATAAKGFYSGYVLIEGGNAAYRMPFGFRIADKGIAALTALKPVMSTRTENVYSRSCPSRSTSSRTCATSTPTSSTRRAVRTSATSEPSTRSGCVRTSTTGPFA
ncbi:MAG: hypothetical protein IPP00_03045 [Actinomycetales bacterium]|uniref:Uncharacterized protein n=1 Tax=Candidatus Phosphoribacter hodrii TaxID=2953743 RepID=A0A9D7XWN7_9MICO|nr:hypothetical protein [Candidatus Phosphoribacter hodrii]